jgi:hypothetical protein
MFSSILQQQQGTTTTTSTSNGAKFPIVSPSDKKIDNENYQNKRVKRSKSEEKSETSSSSALNNNNQENFEKLRKKNALPLIKEKHLSSKYISFLKISFFKTFSSFSVCSKTIWIGHLAKTTTEDDLKSIVESYGQIIDIHVCHYFNFLFLVQLFFCNYR